MSFDFSSVHMVVLLEKAHNVIEAHVLHEMELIRDALLEWRLLVNVSANDDQ